MYSELEKTLAASWTTSRATSSSRQAGPPGTTTRRSRWQVAAPLLPRPP